MALTISAQILGQEATTVSTYCYLYEPLRVVVSEDDNTATKLYIDLKILDTENSGTIIQYLTKYAEFDINIGKGIPIDLMKIAQQYHDADIFKYANISEIVSDGYGGVVSKVRYEFIFYTDKTAIIAANSVVKLPIIGGRDLRNFTPLVDENSPITEDLIFGTNKFWNGWPYVTAALVAPATVDASPTLALVTPVTGDEVCGDYIIWKSRFGGWMRWGFELSIIVDSKSYGGQLEVGMFDSTFEIGGSPYIQTDYTEIRSTYSLSLKSIGLEKAQLNAVAGILISPIVYWVHAKTGELELMRVSSASAPRDSKANGGDFTVTLQSISKTIQKVR